MIRQAIVTKYHGPSNTKPSRISATSASGQRIMISYPHDLTTDDAHRRAAEALCAKLGWEGDKLIAGGMKDGCVFVFAD